MTRYKKKSHKLRNSRTSETQAPIYDFFRAITPARNFVLTQKKIDTTAKVAYKKGILFIIILSIAYEELRYILYPNLYLWFTYYTIAE